MNYSTDIFDSQFFLDYSVANETKALQGFHSPHFLMPSLNKTIDASTSSKLVQHPINEYTSFPNICSLPVPINFVGVLKGKSINGIDHITKLVNEKNMWEKRKSELININVRLKRNYFQNSRQKKFQKISKATVKLAQHLCLDPDPSFSGYYNWYYTRGCLNSFSLNNSHSLLHVDNNLPGTCVVTPVNSENSECTLLKDKSVYLKTNNKQHIYQVYVKNNFIAVRQNNCTSLFVATDDKELKFKKIHRHSETQDNIVSVSISDDLDGEYCTLTTSRKLKLWSPEVRNDCIMCVKLKYNEKSDNWGSVLYTSINNILVSSRSFLYLKDTRMNLETNVDKWTVNVNELPCDFISMMIKSNSHSYCTYIGTTHNLYELDFRKGLSKQWSHMMELPPMYCAIDPVFNTSEMLYIGSQNLSEVCAIDSNLHVMPYILPSLNDAKSKMNYRGLCFDPLVSSRFHFGMVGMTVIPDNRNNSTFLFRGTSVDDIFYQSIYKDEQTFCHDYEYDLYSNWEKNCNKSVNLVKPTQCKVGDIKDFSEVFQNDITLLNNVANDKLSSKKTNFSWAISNRRLLKDHDNLSKRLTDVWEIENTDEQISDNDRLETVEEEPTTTVPTMDREIFENETGILDNDLEDAERNDSEANPVNETVTPRPLYTTVEDSRILYHNAILPPENSGNVSSGFLQYDMFDDTYFDGYSNSVTPTKSLQKKTPKSGVKKKSRFSSGF